MIQLLKKELDLVTSKGCPPWRRWPQFVHSANYYYYFLKKNWTSGSNNKKSRGQFCWFDMKFGRSCVFCQFQIEKLKKNGTPCFEFRAIYKHHAGGVDVTTFSYRHPPPRVSSSFFFFFLKASTVIHCQIKIRSIQLKTKKEKIFKPNSF